MLIEEDIGKRIGKNRKDDKDAKTKRGITTENTEDTEREL